MQSLVGNSHGVGYKSGESVKVVTLIPSSLTVRENKNGLKGSPCWSPSLGRNISFEINVYLKLIWMQELRMDLYFLKRMEICLVSPVLKDMTRWSFSLQ